MKLERLAILILCVLFTTQVVMAACSTPDPSDVDDDDDASYQAFEVIDVALQLHAPLLGDEPEMCGWVEPTPADPTIDPRFVLDLDARGPPR